MYKIVYNTDDINALNAAVKIKENNENALYCEINKANGEDKYAIPIVTDYLKSKGMVDLCPFINDSWLSTRIVNIIPSDWEWLHKTVFRIEIPNKIILIDEIIFALNEYIKQNGVLYDVKDYSTYVYVNYILPEHLELFKKYEEIKILERDR